MLTHVTGTTGIGRVYPYHGHARPLCFIGDIQPQLVKTPRTQLPTHLSIETVSSISDSREGFKGECLTECFCLFYQTLCDAVVHPLGKARFTAAHFLKATLRRLAPTFLQPFAKGAETAANGTYGFASMLPPFAIGCKCNNTEVNPDATIGGRRRQFFGFAGRKQVKLPANETKVALSLLCLEQLCLMFSTLVRHGDTPLNSPNRNHAFFRYKTQDSAIESDRACLLERAFRYFIQLVSVGNFGDTTNGDLRGDTELLSHGVIIPVVQVELLELVVTPRPLTDSVTSGVGGTKGSQQSGSLLGGDYQFDLCYQFQRVLLLRKKLFALSVIDARFNDLPNCSAIYATIRGVTDRPDVKRPRPKGRHFQQFGELFSQLMRRTALDLRDNSVRRNVGRSGDEQVNMVWHDAQSCSGNFRNFKRDNSRIESPAFFPTQFLAPGCNIAYQALTPILRAESEVVIEGEHPMPGTRLCPSRNKLFVL